VIVDRAIHLARYRPVAALARFGGCGGLRSLEQTSTNGLEFDVRRELQLGSTALEIHHEMLVLGVKCCSVVTSFTIVYGVDLAAKQSEDSKDRFQM
jgi:hypothetical protein